MVASNQNVPFVLCIEDKDADDIEKGKVYRVLHDSRAEKDGFIRIVDESAEDYLYPESYFVPINLPVEAQKALSA